MTLSDLLVAALATALLAATMTSAHVASVRRSAPTSTGQDSTDPCSATGEAFHDYHTTGTVYLVICADSCCLMERKISRLIIANCAMRAAKCQIIYAVRELVAAQACVPTC